MSCVDYAINAIINRSSISPYVLKMAFENRNRGVLNNNYHVPDQETIIQGLREKVIYGIVLPACNVRGGNTENIDLTGSRIENLGAGNIYVNVPDYITNGRKIINVIKVTPGSIVGANGFVNYGGNYGNSEPCGSGIESDVGASFLNSLSPRFPVEYTNVSMMGNNSFVIHNCPTFTNNFIAQVYLSYDENLSSINIKHYEDFTKLVEFATKAYIYRNLRHPTSEAIALSGVSVDGIKDEINEYADANENFKEFLMDEWTRCMVNSDTILKNKFIVQITKTRI